MLDRNYIKPIPKTIVAAIKRKDKNVIKRPAETLAFIPTYPRGKKSL